MEPPTTRSDLGIYVHIPFCDRVCPYCDFAVEAVGQVSKEQEQETLDLLVAELDRVRRELGDAVEGRGLATLYLGGGTPSLLSPNGVQGLLRALQSPFHGEPSEVSLELNPGRIEAARIPGFRDAGVTRISVGVQSFDDATLKRLGRAHSGRDALAGLEHSIGAGFRSVSVDLIYGAPGQTEEVVRRDIERVVDLGVPHVSAYALTIEPGTPFALAQQRGQLALPSEGALARMARALEAELHAAGYRRYEISSFAQPGHQSQHNQRYWQRKDVLGLGPSAASLIGNLRTRNWRKRGAWASALRADRLAWEEVECLSGVDARREALFLAFRMTDGLSRSDYWRRYGRRPEEDFAAEIGDLLGLGLLEEARGRLRPTALGIRFSNEVLLRFAAVDPPGAGS